MARLPLNIQETIISFSKSFLNRVDTLGEEGRSNLSHYAVDA